MVPAASPAPPLTPSWRKKVPPAAQKKTMHFSPARRRARQQARRPHHSELSAALDASDGACFLTKAASMAPPPPQAWTWTWAWAPAPARAPGSGLAAGQQASLRCANTRQLLRHLLCLCLQPGGGWVPRVGRANSVGGWVGAAASLGRKLRPMHTQFDA